MNNKTPEEIQKEKELLYKQSMIRAHVQAYITRASNAGIPEKYMRINNEQFKSLLDETYHKNNLNKVVDFVYKLPSDKSNNPLLKKSFIVIDGGTIESRKRAGFAIMFRMITFNKTAKFFDCNALVHKFNTFDTKNVEIGERRTDLADKLKEIDVLFISEFRKGIFNDKCEGGNFVDEVLDARCNYSYPTIITFQETIQPSNSFANDVCGRYLSELSYREYCGKDKDSENPSETLLRIRTKLI